MQNLNIELNLNMNLLVCRLQYYTYWIPNEIFYMYRNIFNFKNHYCLSVYSILSKELQFLPQFLRSGQYFYQTSHSLFFQKLPLLRNLTKAGFFKIPLYFNNFGSHNSFARSFSFFTWFYDFVSQNVPSKHWF